MKRSAPSPAALGELLGGIDIYLLDQVLRGRVVPGARVLDAGCGHGRNLVYFLRAGFRVAAADADPEAIAAVRQLAAHLAPQLPAENFRQEAVEAMGFADASADLVISNAVLHFARDDGHFRRMLSGSWRPLAPGGLFFCRLASRIGLPEASFIPLGGGRYRVPDGSERFLVDQETLFALTAELGGELVDPIKTTVVQGLRSMTTWVVRKVG